MQVNVSIYVSIYPKNLYPEFFTILRTVVPLQEMPDSNLGLNHAYKRKAVLPRILLTLLKELVLYLQKEFLRLNCLH